MIFDFAEVARRDRHKLLTATIIPRPIAWVSTLSRDGVANLAPFAFFNAFGDEPPVLGLGIGKQDGALTDTGRNILETGEFVVNLTPARLLDQIEITSRRYPPEVDEFAEAGLTKAQSLRIAAPRVAESPVAFECRLLREVDLGPARLIVIGEVLAMHVDDAAVIDADRRHIDSERLDLVARVAAGGYARAGAALTPEKA